MVLDKEFYPEVEVFETRAEAEEAVEKEVEWRHHEGGRREGHVYLMEVVEDRPIRYYV